MSTSPEATVEQIAEHDTQAGNWVTMNRRYFKIEDLVARYGCHKSTIYRLIKSGDLPPPVRIGGLARWRLDEIVAAERHAAEAREIA